MAKADIENERKQLNQMCRELLIHMGNLEDMEKCITAMKQEAVELYKEIDKKLNGA